MAYIGPGPSAVHHTDTVCRSSRALSVYSVPTRIGTPTLATAASTASRVGASVRTSRSVEFSGHTTKSGAGSVPDAASAASARVWASEL